MTAVTLISWKVTLCDYHHFNNRNFMPVSDNCSGNCQRVTVGVCEGVEKSWM